MVINVMRSDAESKLNLPPGFRFHPTDEELVVHYLCRKAACQTIPVPIIAEVDLYKYNPWLLPEKALFGTKEWYFFTPRDRKYPNGSRPNRAAGCGYWKATGADKPVRPSGSMKPVAIKKALVFYNGKAPHGVKTDWIMHEYRLADSNRSSKKNGSLRLDDWVLCRLYNKKNKWDRMDCRGNAVEESISENAQMTEDSVSDSLRTPESDIEHDPALQGVFQQGLSSGNGQVDDCVGVRVKEDNDWFMDLNFDELHSLGFVGSTTTPSVDLANHDYWLANLGSPNLKSNQYNFSSFFAS